MNSKENINDELKAIHSKLYELEMNEALEELYNSFGKWKRKSLSPIEMQTKIHEFYKYRAKELFSLYEVASFADLNAARCVKEGKLSLNDLSPELRAIIEPKIKFV